MTTREKLDHALEVINCIYKDAQMALEDEWDRNDEGFESQQILIEKFLKKTKEKIPAIE